MRSFSEIYFEFFNRTYVISFLFTLWWCYLIYLVFLYWFLHLFNRFWVKKFEFSLYIAARLNKYWILHYFFKFSRNILVLCIISLKISKNSRFVQSCQFIWNSFYLIQWRNNDFFNYFFQSHIFLNAFYILKCILHFNCIGCIYKIKNWRIIGDVE